jgi:WD40 repeat protein
MADPIILDAHGRHAQAVQFNKKGDLLISVGQGAKVRLWSAPDFKFVKAFEGHANSVNTISFSPSEKHLATGSTDGTVRVWSFPEGECRFVLKNQLIAKFAPAGDYLATLSKKGSVVLWQERGATELAEFAKLDKRLFNLAFSPDARHLLVGGASGIHVLQLPDGEKVDTLKAHAPAVACLLFSPDKKRLASSGADGSIRLWRASDWSPVRQIKLDAGGIYQLAFSPDGQTMAVSMDNKIQLFNVSDGSQEKQFDVGVKGVYGLAFSPNGKHLVNAAADGKIRIWELN